MAPNGNIIAGLFLDLVGISVLFFFQVDRNHHLNPDGQIGIVVRDRDEAEKKKWKRYRRLTVVGFVLLILGFALQIFGAVRLSIY